MKIFQSFQIIAKNIPILECIGVVITICHTYPENGWGGGNPLYGVDRYLQWVGTVFQPF